MPLSSEESLESLTRSIRKKEGELALLHRKIQRLERKKLLVDRMIDRYQASRTAWSIVRLIIELSFVSPRHAMGLVADIVSHLATPQAAAVSHVKDDRKLPESILRQLA